MTATRILLRAGPDPRAAREPAVRGGAPGTIVRPGSRMDVRIHDITAEGAGIARAGALVVADNASLIEDYVAHVRSSENGYLSTPIQEDVELSMRLG